MKIWNRRGMTLIELLVVIAIISILATITMVYYRSQYISKARLSEVTQSMGAVATSVASYYRDSSSFPTAGDFVAIQNTLGVQVPGSRISAMDVNEGVITATISNIAPEVDGGELVLSPSTDSGGSVVWVWSGTIPSVYIPRR
jgi:prepilin-type N-terminal cleavage/methylation domain-containing protein